MGLLLSPPTVIQMYNKLSGRQGVDLLRSFGEVPIEARRSPFSAARHNIHGSSENIGVQISMFTGTD